jgi:hypothetical protein
MESGFETLQPIWGILNPINDKMYDGPIEHPSVGGKSPRSSPSSLPPTLSQLLKEMVDTINTTTKYLRFSQNILHHKGIMFYSEISPMVRDFHKMHVDGDIDIRVAFNKICCFVWSYFYCQIKLQPGGFLFNTRSLYVRNWMDLMMQQLYDSQGGGYESFQELEDVVRVMDRTQYTSEGDAAITMRCSESGEQAETT